LVPAQSRILRDAMGTPGKSGSGSETRQIGF
jgi:hypothetical protein